MEQTKSIEMNEPMVKMDEILYVIKWKVRKTGITGQGTGTFPYEEAKRYADEMNKEDTYLYHWSEKEK